MVWERIPSEGWRQELGHVARYERAARMLEPGDVVLDAACGVGYGAIVLEEHGPAHTYLGIDRPGPTPNLLDPERFRGADLDSWEPDFDFDVAVSFETLEHLADPQRFARILLRARRLVLASVPTVPTKHSNPYHLHDFTVESALELFSGATVLEVIPQPEELSHIFVIRPSGA